MMKKKLLLSIFVASLVVTSALALNACKKNAEGSGDVIPTVITEIRGATDWAACDHCPNPVWDFTYWAPIVGPESDSVKHVHEYAEGSACALPHCRYDGRHHVHIVTYFIDPITGEDNYHDQWIHIGGGGGGE